MGRRQVKAERKKTVFTTVEARNGFSEVINLAAYGKERIALTRRGKVIAYVVPPDDAEVLVAIEDQIGAKVPRGPGMRGK